MYSNIKQKTMENLRDQSLEVVSLNRNSSGTTDDDSGSSTDSDGEESYVELNPKKKQRLEAVLPVGFLDLIIPRPAEKQTVSSSTGADGGVSTSCAMVRVVKEECGEDASNVVSKEIVAVERGGYDNSAVGLVMRRSCKQFWKAGDYEGSGDGDNNVSLEEMDHVRVHPKFLHSNATSHKWSLGALAELLDNALDEVCNGATYVHVDLVENMKDRRNKMVLVQDNGGGMTPDKMRSCMSLGYSAKSKMANTIGQYGNGFKTSTMRLGADVIVFSRCQAKTGNRATQSIGLLSFTFLQNTGKEDVVVPMIDYEKMGDYWNKRVKSSFDCWQRNLETIVQWSPYESEHDLLQQFNFLEDQGTRIIIYNLWEDDEGLLELDFDADQHDIQLRGVNRDEKKIEMAKKFPSSSHFLTYSHSLRSYASILYRVIPPGFRIILRGKDVEHHNMLDDIIHPQEIVYKPAAACGRDPNMVAEVRLGFIKDAHHHIDVQGFNVYHKNRLIKPFWRVWNAAGSDGRGVIGVLEANFVEPAHDKQGFERTTALSRLEARLMHYQKNYWSTKCQFIGYAQRRNLKKYVAPEKEAARYAKDNSNSNVTPEKEASIRAKNNFNSSATPEKEDLASAKQSSYYMYNRNGTIHNKGTATALRTQFEAQGGNYNNNPYPWRAECPPDHATANVHVKTEGTSEDGSIPFSSITGMVLRLKQENDSLNNRLNDVLQDLHYERDKNNSLENQLQDMKKMMDKIDHEQEVFISSFTEERSRRDEQEDKLRDKLREASETIAALLRKLRRLDASSSA